MASRNRGQVHLRSDRRTCLRLVVLALIMGIGTVVFPAFSQEPPAGVSGQRRLPGTGIVTRVSDGDSFWVRFADGGQRRVRLIGVNSPELNDQKEDAAFWAFLARRFSFFHLRGRNVRLEYDETPVDEYGRILAYLLTGDGVLFNEFIIREGYAYAFLKYPFRRDYRARFRQAEADAKRAGRGLWQSGPPATITAFAAGSNLGRFLGVRFDCATVTRERGFILLRAAGKDFEALIPLARSSVFPKLEDYAGRTVTVVGFLEAFHGRPQIILNFPRQLLIE